MSEYFFPYFRPTDLFALSVRGGVVCHLEGVEVQDILHLIVVPSSLANDGGHVEQKDVSEKRKKKVIADLMM